jgi:hypothetical protein
MRRVALLMLIVSGVLAAPALAHEGNADFESLVTSAGGVPGLRAEVLNGDDRLLLVNDGSRTVVVRGYDDEPYARLRPDGTVEVNRRSEATYLNDERFGDVRVPAIADNAAEPDWRVVSRTGRFEFHDHRIHWMAQGDPPKVTDKSERQKVFDWSVPLRVEGGGPAAVRGTLWWRGEGGGAPVGMFAGLAAFALLGLLMVVVVRRRRRAAAARPASEAGAPEGREAW